MKRYQVVIIGAGPAGVSAAIWSNRLSLTTCMIEKTNKIGGKLGYIHNPLVDYPGFSYGLGEDLVQAFQEHLSSTNITVRLSESVVRIDPIERIVYTELDVIGYEDVIVATGAKDRSLSIPGEHLLQKQTYSASRDSKLFQGRRVCVVGGGDRALEGALLLADAGAEVALVHRSDQFRARAEFLNQVTEHDNIHVLTHRIVTAILGESTIQAVELFDTQTNQKSASLPVDAVFVRIGVEPDYRLIEERIERNPDGTCKVDSYFETSQSHVFCVGDALIHPDYASIAAAVGQGMIAAKRISLRLEEETKRV